MAMSPGSEATIPSTACYGDPTCDSSRGRATCFAALPLCRSVYMPPPCTDFEVGFLSCDSQALISSFMLPFLRPFRGHECFCVVSRVCASDACPHGDKPSRLLHR